METDLCYPLISEFLERYPLQAGPIYSTYTDLALSQQWREIRLIGLKDIEWAAFFGRKKKEDLVRMVLPLHITAKNLTPRILRSLFAELARLKLEDFPEAIPSPIGVPAISEDEEQGSGHYVITEGDEGAKERTGAATARLDQETIYISIATPDSSIVYYKLTKWIKKPDDVPDE